MRLIVKQDNSTISEFRFGEGPIYIGRHKDSQIFLGHRAVSRQHAVLFHTDDGKWMVEDLDSANKTYLNDQEVHKAQIKTGDVLRIVDFVIEINLEEDAEARKPIDMEDTLTKTAYEMQTALSGSAMQPIVQSLGQAQAPTMKLQSKRLRDFMQASDAITRADGYDGLLLSLLDVCLKQFDASRVWGALRNRPSGPMTAHAGKQRDGKKLDVSQIGVADRLVEAVDKCQFILLPELGAEAEAQQKATSAMIAPIACVAGCFGVLYLDRSDGKRRYDSDDLDYLMLLSVHTAAIMRKLASS